MRDIDPHWDTGEGGHSAAPQPIPMPEAVERVMPLPASRRPAALVGILLVFALGFFFTRGMTGLMGQVTPAPATPPPQAPADSALTVHITNTGVNPLSITVHPGDTITWKNDQDMPHILTSSTLKDTDGKPLNTPPIFPGMSYAFHISNSQNGGTHTYVSQTSTAVSGTVEVIGSAGKSSAGAANSNGTVIETFSNADMRANTSSKAAVPATIFTDNSSISAAPASGLIPENPYSVTSTKQHPFDANGNPIASLFDANGKNPKTAAPATPRPLRQPASGPEIWSIVCGALLTLIWISRKSLHRVQK